ncbi:uncharacterized protein LOC142984060 [Anticarsia gemmatalis]|uniref:uncharacterized protein LOC142984060 n=1 Tax=Anticarsia gemmatalis TaxID=129554 RepID=UPI003F76FFD9
MIIKQKWNLRKLLVCSKRLYRSQKHLVACGVFVAAFLIIGVYIVTNKEEFADFKKTNIIVKTRLSQSVLEEKGTGCEIPNLDPFSEDAMMFKKEPSKIVCDGTDWVNCYRSKCMVDRDILKTMKDVECTYRDIIYVNDSYYYLGEAVVVKEAESYALNKSDHVKVSCTGTDINGLGLISSTWSSYKAGFRHIPLPVRPDLKDAYNVLFLAFDSISHNGFIRSMPKSYQYLIEDLDAVFLNGHSIVGDGTPAALFPILTGRDELEHPDTRKTLAKDQFLDHRTFIFNHVKENGYRTAYFEDMPWIGTFQYRFNGFRHQPADHYLRAFFTEEAKSRRKWWGGISDKHCLGAVPMYQFMLDLTEQFFSLDGKKFAFTFISDVTHDDFNMISNADDAFLRLLMNMVVKKLFEDTLVIVMGDHGTRFASIRNTYQGRIEERLPLMAIILPERLQKLRPEALKALKYNKDVLTTHFDIYPTVLDVLDMKKLSNTYKVPGSDLPRAMTLLEKIPKFRTCGEAGVLPHWCVCTKWYNVSRTNPFYEQVAKVLARYIDGISDEKRDKCAMRKLVSIEWVLQQSPNDGLLKFSASKEVHSYLGNPVKPSVRAPNEYYQTKIVMSPGNAVFEGTMIFNVKSNNFYITERDISRINE